MLPPKAKCCSKRLVQIFQKFQSLSELFLYAFLSLLNFLPVEVQTGREGESEAQPPHAQYSLALVFSRRKG